MEFGCSTLMEEHKYRATVSYVDENDGQQAISSTFY